MLVGTSEGHHTVAYVAILVLLRGRQRSHGVLLSADVGHAHHVGLVGFSAQTLQGSLLLIDRDGQFGDLIITPLEFAIQGSHLILDL